MVQGLANLLASFLPARMIRVRGTRTQRCFSQWFLLLRPGDTVATVWSNPWEG